MWRIHRWPVDSPHKGPLTRKMLPFDDVIMIGRNNMGCHWSCWYRYLNWNQNDFVICLEIRNLFCYKPHNNFLMLILPQIFNRLTSSRPGQNGCHFVDDDFWCILILLNEIVCILFKIWLKFVPKGPIDNKWALVQIMAWSRIGDKPLPEPMLIQFTDAYTCMRH